MLVKSVGSFGINPMDAIVIYDEVLNVIVGTLGIIYNPANPVRAGVLMDRFVGSGMRGMRFLKPCDFGLPNKVLHVLQLALTELVVRPIPQKNPSSIPGANRGKPSTL